jgi:hypothetical protein
LDFFHDVHIVAFDVLQDVIGDVEFKVLDHSSQDSYDVIELLGPKKVKVIFYSPRIEVNFSGDTIIHKINLKRNIGSLIIIDVKLIQGVLMLLFRPAIDTGVSDGKLRGVQRRQLPQCDEVNVIHIHKFSFIERAVYALQISLDQEVIFQGGLTKLHKLPKGIWAIRDVVPFGV